MDNKLLHLDTLIGEELRLIKKADWDSIAMPMLVRRRAGFRNRPEYAERIDLDEETKVICITSNRTKNEWFNTMYNRTFSNHFKNPHSRNNVLSFDIFLAIEHGLKSAAWYLQQKVEMDEMSFRMEILNETVGEVEGAYFSYELINKNQLLREAFMPPNDEEFNAKLARNRKKKDGEIRLMFVDFAFSDSTSKEKNDNTAIGCMSIYKKGGKYIRDVDYFEIHSGGETERTMVRIREIFWDYKSDYIVYDNRSGGEVIYTFLTKEMYHESRPSSEWNHHGFTVCNEDYLHIAKDAKVDNLREKAIDPDAIPCLIPMIGSSDLNSTMWQNLKRVLRDEEMQLLIDVMDLDNIMVNDKRYFKLTSEEKARIKIPFVETMLLKKELTELTQKWSSGLLYLNEPRSGTKDRAVSLSYGNYIATLIIDHLQKEEKNKTSGFDPSQWQFIV